MKKSLFLKRTLVFLSYINWFTFTTKQTNSVNYSQNIITIFHFLPRYTPMIIVFCLFKYLVFREKEIFLQHRIEAHTKTKTVQHPRTMRLHLFFWWLKTDQLTTKNDMLIPGVKRIRCATTAKSKQSINIFVGFFSSLVCVCFIRFSLFVFGGRKKNTNTTQKLSTKWKESSCRVLVTQNRLKILLRFFFLYAIFF